MTFTPFSEDEEEPEEPEPTTYTITFNITDLNDNEILDAVIELKDDSENIIEPVAYGLFEVEQGDYTYTVEKEGYISDGGDVVIVDSNIIKNIVLEQESSEPDYIITIDGDSEIMFGLTKTYIAKLFDRGTEITDKEITFTIDKPDIANIVSQGGNQCKVKTNNTYTYGAVMLKATLVEDGDIFTEKKINIIGF